MVVEAQLTVAGVTKGKRYNVIEKIKPINCYKIKLDDGTIGVRHRCGFKVVKE